MKIGDAPFPQGLLMSRHWSEEFCELHFQHDDRAKSGVSANDVKLFVVQQHFSAHQHAVPLIPWQ